MTRLRAHFDGKVLIPEGPVDLPQDRVLDIEVRDAADPPLGSGAAILRAVRSPPHVTREDVQALEDAIREGQRPADMRGCFDEDES
jgi:hypothetical protein